MSVLSGICPVCGKLMQVTYETSGEADATIIKMAKSKCLETPGCLGRVILRPEQAEDDDDFP